MGLEYSGYDDGEAPVNFHCEIVAKSKLNHRCTECRGIIEKGESYERSSGIWDGHWSTYRKCTRCMALESAMEGHYRGFFHSSPFGEMLSDARQALPDLYSIDHPGRWFGVARKLVAVRKKYEDQMRRCVEDKSGKGNPRRLNYLWTRVKHTNLLRQLTNEENQEREQLQEPS